MDIKSILMWRLSVLTDLLGLRSQALAEKYDNAENEILLSYIKHTPKAV